MAYNIQQTVHVIGNIDKAYVKGIFGGYCKWEIVFDDNTYSVEKGQKQGQSWIAINENVCKNNKQ